VIDLMFEPPKKDDDGVISKAAQTRYDNNVLLLKQAVKEEALLPQYTQTSGINYWTLLNGVTRFVDHSQQVQTRKRDLVEVRFDRNLFGGGDQLKNRVAKQIVKMAA